MDLLDKKKFEKLEETKHLWLKGLSMKEAIRLEEALISSHLIWEWRRNFSKDNPLCLKEGLKRKS